MQNDFKNGFVSVGWDGTELGARRKRSKVLDMGQVLCARCLRSPIGHVTVPVAERMSRTRDEKILVLYTTNNRTSIMLAEFHEGAILDFERE